MRPITVTAGPLSAAVATGICLSQTPVAAGSLAINGSYATNGIAKLGVQRRVGIASTANDTTVNFTITGTNWSGTVISEVLAGPNTATVQSVLDYLTVTSITNSAATTGAITVGTTAVGSSPWAMMDAFSLSQIAIQADPKSVTATIEQTLDDPNDPTNPISPALMNWLPHPDPALNTFSLPVQGNYGYAPVYARVTITAGTGTVAAKFIQAAVVPK